MPGTALLFCPLRWPSSRRKLKFGIRRYLETCFIARSELSRGLGECKFPSTNPSNFLVDLEKELRLEFTEISKMEEEYWAMKFRITWLVEADRNTCFHHTLALVRGRRNQISCMKDRVGNWIQGDKEIADFIRSGYVELFSSSHRYFVLANWDPPFWQNFLNEEDLTNMICLISNEEISAGLWSLKAYKALGLDGLHIGFFQHFWLLVGDSVKSKVKHIFLSGKFPKYLNKTVITLIPKCGNPKSFNHYHPISLCNMVYKIVIKIIVAWFRPLLPSLVSSLQTAFVPGCKGIDNAIIV